MLVNIDKRGSIKIPAAVLKELGLKPGTFLDLTVVEGGHLALVPVEVYPSVRLSKQGLSKLEESRQSGSRELPGWLRKEIADAATGLD